jgi:hypothetical protein
MMHCPEVNVLVPVLQPQASFGLDHGSLCS